MSRAYWVGLIGSLAIRVLGPTWRMRTTGEFDGPRPDRIYALLHGQMLFPAFRFRGLGVPVMVSRHGDGEMIARAVERLGYRTVRGSSTRGGAAAVRELVQRFPDVPWVVTPDGPKGPRGSVKEGLVRLAAESGRLIQPVAGAGSRVLQFSSWDRFAVPWPFARVALYFGTPLAVPHDIAPDRLAPLAREIETRLAEAEEKAAQSLEGG